MHISTQGKHLWCRSKHYFFLGKSIPPKHTIVQMFQVFFVKWPQQQHNNTEKWKWKSFECNMMCNNFGKQIKLSRPVPSVQCAEQFFFNGCADKSRTLKVNKKQTSMKLQKISQSRRFFNYLLFKWISGTNSRKCMVVCAPSHCTVPSAVPGICMNKQENFALK